MQFTIGSFEYAVRRRWALSLDGEPVDGFAAHADCVIWIDGSIEGAEAVSLLRHEHLHAWEWRSGSTRLYAEDRAQFASMVGATFDRDFTAGGGLEGLMTLPVEGIRKSAARAKQAEFENPFQHNRSCGACGATIAPGSIASDEPVELSPTLRIVDRWMSCPFCAAVTTWREQVNEHHIPTGAIIHAELLTGAQASRWRETHADLPMPYAI